MKTFKTLFLAFLVVGIFGQSKAQTNAHPKLDDVILFASDGQAASEAIGNELNNLTKALIFPFISPNVPAYLSVVANNVPLVHQAADSVVAAIQDAANIDSRIDPQLAISYADVMKLAIDSVDELSTRLGNKINNGVILGRLALAQEIQLYLYLVEQSAENIITIANDYKLLPPLQNLVKVQFSLVNESNAAPVSNPDEWAGFYAYDLNSNTYYYAGTDPNLPANVIYDLPPGIYELGAQNRLPGSEYGINIQVINLQPSLPANANGEVEITLEMWVE